jgi:uncharacterized protein
MEFKYSRFNIVSKIKENTFSLYNTKTGKHIVIHAEDDSILLQKPQDDSSISSLSDELRDGLYECGFIVNYDVNEEKELRELMYADKQKKCSGLYLTILPTLQCNFSCIYCYENPDTLRSNCFMNKKTANSIVEFVKAKLENNVISEVVVKWFGGEPLLAKNTMMDLSKKIKKLASEFGKGYRAFLISNGYLLDKLLPSEIAELACYAIQITVDGPKDIHNKRRPTKSGSQTFEKIIDNVEKLATYYKHIVLRINVDIDNAAHIHNLLKYLKNRGIIDVCQQISVVHVDTQIGKYSQELQCSYALSRKTIIDIDKTISENLIKENLEELFPIKYPRFLSVACDAQIGNHFVINPEGYVFKCTGDATFRERSIFNLVTGEKINPLREQEFMSVPNQLASACQSCSLLPVCQGGCPAKYLDIKHAAPFCPSSSYLVEQNLIRLAERKK